MWNTVQVINQFKEVWHSDVVKKIKNSFFFNVFVLYYMLHITHVMSIKLLDKVCIGHNFMDMFFWSFFLTDRIQCEALRYYIHYSGSIIETWVGLVFAVIGRLLYTFLILFARDCIISNTNCLKNLYSFVHLFGWLIIYAFIIYSFHIYGIIFVLLITIYCKGL